MKKIINKISARSLKDLNAFQSFISHVLTMLSIGAIIAALSVFTSIYLSYRAQEKYATTELINSANSILAANISEQLSIITNTQDFVNYLRSGAVSRKQNYADIAWLFSGLDKHLITGVLITQNDQLPLFSYGNKSKSHATLSLCYINTRINSHLGQCNHQLVIYFNKENYLASLNKINPHIESCKTDSCVHYNPLSVKEFGSFPVVNFGNLMLDLKYVQPQSHALLLALCVFIVFILILLTLSQLIIKKLVKRYLINPVRAIQENLGNKNCYTKEKYFLYEFSYLSEAIKKYQEQKINIELNKKAIQVAHDIRSPLSALQILAEKNLIEVEESKRILLRDAVYQIRDIVNNLDQSTSNKKTLMPIVTLLEAVLSERRTAFSNKNVALETIIPNEAYGFFVDVIPSEIKRVMTNLINNAVEALPAINGYVEIKLCHQEQNICFIVKDNGCGIPEEMISKLFSRGITTKESGSGLGLFHAKETIMQWGGTIRLNSTLNTGTTVTVKLPEQMPPQWFIATLSLPSNAVIICVDDSVSIWNVWQERFKSMSNAIELRYCKDKAALLLELGIDEKRSRTYLVDYEFSGQSYTGFDLIKKIITFKKKEDNIFLVTSHSGEEIQKFCIEHGIKMISKFFALKIPINILFY